MVIWGFYDDLIQGLLEVEVEKLAGYELEALALQTDTGESWLDEAGGDESVPIFMPEIVDLMCSSLMGEAGDWSKPVLREYSS